MSKAVILQFILIVVETSLHGAVHLMFTDGAAHLSKASEAR